MKVKWKFPFLFISLWSLKCISIRIKIIVFGWIESIKGKLTYISGCNTHMTPSVFHTLLNLSIKLLKSINILLKRNDLHIKGTNFHQEVRYFAKLQIRVIKKPTLLWSQYVIINKHFKGQIHNTKSYHDTMIPYLNDNKILVSTHHSSEN